MSALTMMPKVVAVLRKYANGSQEWRVFDAGDIARQMLAELRADGINVDAPPKVTEPRT